MVKHFILLILGIWLANAEGARISLDEHSIRALPDENHLKKEENIEVLSSIDCSAKVFSNHIELPAKCGYLHGLYRYAFTEQAGGIKKQSLTDFAVTLESKEARTLLVNDPMIIHKPHVKVLPAN